MKKMYVFISFLSLVLGCTSFQKDSQSGKVQELDKEMYTSFGASLTDATILTASDLHDVYSDMVVGDTIQLTLSSTVNSVCKSKGCWMKVNVNDSTEARVTFKDYGFFMPKDIENDTIIAQGKAFIAVSSVEDQKHFAEDAGKSEEEISQITQPEMTYSFIADGVLLKN
ncbi:DUF4920 domain-containing protein [Aquimarina sp. 2-A2]|uniref:DUF4920 domain-containing protein n=1 Tax=Aquimarina sp. 2-A2 TaxID=3382644 RepID=UPI00387F1CB4